MVFAILLASLGCTTHAVLQDKSEYPKHTAPTDLRTKFPPAGQTRIQIVADHLLGKEITFPAGNIADYTTKVSDYQLFLIKEKDTTKAANLISDWRATHQDLTYMSGLGGYYGFDNGHPRLPGSQRADLWVGLDPDWLRTMPICRRAASPLIYNVPSGPTRSR